MGRFRDLFVRAFLAHFDRREHRNVLDAERHQIRRLLRHELGTDELG